MDRKIEQFLIWSIILQPGQLKAVSEVVTEQDFIDTLFKKAYRTLLDMQEKNIEIDTSSLYIEMGRPENISSLLPKDDDQYIPSPAHYARLLKQRNLENEIREAADKREFDVAKEKISEIETLGKPTDLLTISQMIESGSLSNELFKTGFVDLDSILRFRKKDLLVLAGKPGNGKSTIGLSILAYLSLQIPTGMISFEMSPAGIVERLTIMFTTDYLTRIHDNFLVACPPKFNLQEVRKAIQHMQSKKGTSLFVIDYLQLMDEPRRFSSRHLEISYITRQIKELAKEFNVGIILLSQLSRAIDQRGKGARPVLSDVKECVTPGTMISLHGCKRKIKRLYDYGHISFKVKTFNTQTGKIEYVNPEKVIHAGPRHCLKIRTKKGLNIFLGKDTPALTETGWVNARDLILGQKIFTERGVRDISNGVMMNRGSSRFKKGLVPWNKGVKGQVSWNKGSNGKGNKVIKNPNHPSIMRSINPPVGTKKSNRGYILIYKPDWPSAMKNTSVWKGYIFEHRYVIEKKIGRPLRKSEIIHHWDGDKENNQIENLRLCKNSSEHQKIHLAAQRFVEGLSKEGKVYFDDTAFKFRVR